MVVFVFFFNLPFNSPPPKKNQKSKKNLFHYSVEEHGTLCRYNRVEGAISMNNISPRNLECLSNEYNYRTSLIKNFQDVIGAQKYINLWSQWHFSLLLDYTVQEHLHTCSRKRREMSSSYLIYISNVNFVFPQHMLHLLR